MTACKEQHGRIVYRYLSKTEIADFLLRELWRNIRKKLC